MHRVPRVFAERGTLELAKSYAVLSLCRAIPPSIASPLLNAALRLPGAEMVLRHSVFSHFVAGEALEDVRPKVLEMQRNGVGAILDYAAEAEEDPSRQEAPARCYAYAGEAECDAHLKRFDEALEVTAAVGGPATFAAVKLTALVEPKVLSRMAEAITAGTALFHRFRGDASTLDRAQFEKAYEDCFDASKADADYSPKGLFDRLANGRRTIDVVDWTARLRVHDIGSLCRLCKEDGPLKKAALTEEELRKASNFSRRAHQLASNAATLNVRLMVDAEQTWFQPAIDAVVAALQRKHNLEGKANVFNTVQLYRVDAEQRLSLELDRAQRLGFSYGVKLVRGAYIDAERQRASESGSPDPIHSTAQGTHEAYDRAVEIVALAAAECAASDVDGWRVEAMVATHNAASVEAGVASMVRHGVPSGRFHFAQLYGMADHVTYALADQKVSVCKYVPFGPLRATIPYLVRRAHENSSFVNSPSMKQEIAIIRGELLKRLANPFRNVRKETQASGPA
ncbi:FAD-linked oxidoreductase-like protein [Pelagophyceae sp. CCMP2097]|nr:FAD-linked oxidoreductase-like protein [Pelagophyceae sp. CCMP2097]